LIKARIILSVCRKQSDLRLQTCVDLGPTERDEERAPEGCLRGTDLPP